jgi:PAS domain S-box-containing protein
MAEQHFSVRASLTDLLFEEAGAGLCLVAPDGTVLRANKEWLRATGFSLEQVIGEDIIELFPSTRDMALAMHARARRGEPVEVPPHQVQIRGRPTWWDGRISPVPMDGGTGLLITARDITDQVAREASHTSTPASHQSAQATLPRGLSTPASRYVIAAVATCVAFALRLAMSRYFGPPYILFYPTVMLVAVLGGVGPGLLATAMSAVLAAFWILPAERQFLPMSTRDAVGLAVFTGMGVFMSVLADRYRRARYQLTRDRALRESEERFRAFFDNPAVGTAQLDMEGRFKEVNDRCCEITGYPCEELLRMTLEDLWPEEDRERERAALTSFVQHGESHYDRETRCVRKDRSVIWVHLTAGLIHDDAGRPVRWAGVIEEITDRKRAENALRESEKRFRQLADSMPQIIWASRPDGCLDYYNRKWYELTGADEGAHGDQSWLPILHPDDRQRCLDVWYASVRTGKPYQIEYRFKFPSTGDYRWHLGRALAVRDEGGNVVRWFGTCTDIHDQKLATEALQQADLRKNEFLGVLSHELRNPLGPIQNALYIIDSAPPDGEQAHRAKQVIARQVTHLTRLVDDLLDVTRISRGKIQLRRTRVDLTELVRRAVEDHRTIFATREIALSLRLDAGPLWIDADATRLDQALGNLLQNAAKFTNAHGHVAVTVESDGCLATVRVADDGVGISAELQPHVFEPFRQADESLHRSLGGLGLGLALVKGLVEMHGGRVELRSEGVGRGAEFTLSLPLSADAALHAEAAPSRRDAPVRQRVLVIEDNLDAAETLKEVLEMNGQDVVALAYDGQDGVAKARALQPDIVLCDIGLPGFDGYEVARQLRVDPGLAATLVALTGYARPEDQRRAIESGFDHHLGKPVDIAQLQAVLARVAGRNGRASS